MTGHEPGRTQPCDRAETERHDGHRAKVRDHPIPARTGRNVGESAGLEGLDRTAAAGAVDEAYERQTRLIRHLLGLDLLLMDRRIGRTAAYGEVIGCDCDRPALDAAAAEDEVGCTKLQQFAIVAVGAHTGDTADLPEARRIEQPVDTLAHCELAFAPLDRDFFGSAHLARRALAFAQCGDLRIPDFLAHCEAPMLFG